MLGIYLAIFGAILLVFSDALKKHLGHHISYKLLIWNTVLTGIIVGIIACFISGATISDPTYLLWLPVSILLLVLGEITFIKSILHGEFSEVAPIRAIAPIFSLFLAMLFLGERPSIVSLVGVLIVVGGVWLMTPRMPGQWRLKLSSGVKFMVISQFLGVLLAITIKAASEGVSPLIYFTLVMIGEWVYFSAAILHGRIHPIILFRHDPVRAVVMCLLWGVGIISISIAPAYSLVAYAYASGQIYMPVALIVSAVFLKEHKAIERVVPMLLILTGVVLVIFGAS